jgi:hypothetical protein
MAQSCIYPTLNHLVLIPYTNFMEEKVLQILQGLMMATGLFSQPRPVGLPTQTELLPAVNIMAGDTAMRYPINKDLPTIKK